MCLSYPEKKITNARNTEVYYITELNISLNLKINRVEELFKLVEEEFTADQGDLLTTHTPNLTRQNTLERVTLPPNRWPKPQAVIEFAKKLEEMEAIEEAAEV